MELAIFTNKPAFQKPLYVGAPIVEGQVRENYFKYMNQVFDRNCFTNNGPLVQKLESEVARMHGSKYCIAVCNGTIGELLVLKALDLKGEVILPSFTFVATAHTCLWQGAKVVFCDISSDSLMIDAKKAEKLVNKNTCCIIGVHLFGNLCDMPALAELCKNHNMRLIFDAAHAFNCSFKDKPIGFLGDASILSFHATKFFGTFEGGAVLTNDPTLAERIRLLRNFGFRDYDDVGFLGINGKMSESSAAMGLASISFIESRTQRLKNNLLLYRQELVSIPGIKILQVGQNGRSNYQYLVIFVEEKEFGISRDALYKVLWKENVIARRYFYPGCHNMEPYKSLSSQTSIDLQVTEEICRKVLCLPLNLEKPEDDIKIIGDIIKIVNREGVKVSKWVENHL